MKTLINKLFRRRYVLVVRDSIHQMIRVYEEVADELQVQATTTLREIDGLTAADADRYTEVMLRYDAQMLARQAVLDRVADVRREYGLSAV